MQGTCQGCGGALASGGRCMRCSQAPARSRSGAQPALPTAIGPYAVTGLLGQGSFGVVYRVGRGPGPPLALKLLLAQDAQDVRRFEGEVEIARRLQHPGLVALVDAGVHQGPSRSFPYYVMEFCPGETLAQRLRRGRLPPLEAAALVADLARTAAAVHAQGVVHRDLKPSNVILDASTHRPRITDFGLARDAASRIRLTQTGDRMGTPLYMAPELFQDAKRADHRADVYALGVILYECLTGIRPFHGQALTDVAKQVFAGVVRPPRELNARVSPELEAICLRAMARAPGDRQGDADQLADELEALSSAPPPDDATAAGQRPPQAALVATLLLLVIGLAGALALVVRGRASAPAAVARSPSPVSPPAAEPSPSLPVPRSTPADGEPGARRADPAAAWDAIEAARRAERALAPAEEALGHYARARALAGDDPELLAAAGLGELDTLWGRGEQARLHERIAALERTVPSAARAATLFRVRLLRPDDPARRQALRELAGGGQEDGVGLLARALVEMAERGRLDPGLVERALARDPGLTLGYLLLASLAEQAGRAEQAQRQLDEVLARSPNDPDALWALVNVLQRQGRPIEAIPHLERLIALRDARDPRRFEALYQRARMALHLQRWEEGIPYLDRALELRPGDMVGLMLRGLFHLQLGAEARAGEDYRAAALHGLAPFQGALDQRYGSPQLQAAIWDATLEALRLPSPLELAPTAEEALAEQARRAPAALQPQVRALLGAAATGAGWEALEDGWSGLVAAAPDSAAVALLHAEALAGRGQDARALAELERAGGLGEPQASSLRLEADLRFRGGDQGAARALWEELVRLDPQGPEGARARALLGRLQGQPPGAVLEDMERAAAMAPAHAPTQASLATLHMNVGDPLRAIAAADRALVQGCFSLEVALARFWGLARLMLRRERWDVLRAEADRLDPLAPDSPSVRTTVATALSQSTRPDDLARSRALLEALVAAAPDANPLRFLGYVRMRQGDPLEAVLEAWERARAQDPRVGVPSSWLVELRQRFPDFADVDALRGQGPAPR